MTEQSLTLRCRKEELAELAALCPLDDDVPVRVGRRASERGYMTREELLALVEWRYPEGANNCHRNSEVRVQQQSQLAFESTDARSAIASLMKLQGVAWTLASLVLHFAHVDPYPVFDTHGLDAFNIDHYEPRTLSLWTRYIDACRAICDECDLTMRELERAFWQFAQEYGNRALSACTQEVTRRKTQPGT